MQSKQDCCMLKSGTMTSLMRPGSQYAACEHGDRGVSKEFVKS